MAGRIRTIKPELLEDERIAALSSNAFRLFIGCILLADDYGNLRMASGWLGGQVFWHQLDVKRATPTDIEDAKAELLATGPVDPITQKPKAGLLVPYCVRGQVYAHISGWERHQKIDRPGAPRVPGPSEDTNKINDSECIRDIREPLASHSRTAREPFATDHDQDQDPDQYLDQENGASAPGPDGPCSSSMLAASPSETTSSKPPASTPIQPSLPMPLDPVEPSDPALARPLQVTPATAVFQRYIDGWKTHVGGTRPPVLTEKRRNLIKSRIRDGFTHEDLLLAVTGIWLSTWNVSHAQHDFDLVLRDAAHVEKFRALAAPAKSAPGNTGAAALELWKSTYAKSKRAYGDYIAAPRDAEVAAKLAAQAREEATAEVQRKGSGNLEQMAVLLLAHWFRQYLRTDGDKNRNVERRHPLAGLEFGIPSYGAPWGIAAKPKLDDGIRVPTRAESAAAVAALPQAVQATLTSIGQGAASGMPIRPRFSAQAATPSEPS